MQISEGKDAIAWCIDFELRHSRDPEHRNIIHLVKAIHSSVTDLALRISRLEEKLGITEPTAIPGD